MKELVDRALGGDPRAIARLISLVENESPYAYEIMKMIYPYTGNAHIIGVTGSPGAGKSTLVDKLIIEYRKQDKKVGVIAVDPSSPFTGGAVLGDRLRMQRHAVDPMVFIRSMGTRGSLGGVAKATFEAALILDACGKDIVFIETVGVGQSEVDVVRIADTVCLVLVPGMGDSIQLLKAGIMEIADIFVINKADREGVNRLYAEITMILDMSIPKAAEWRPPVYKTIAETGEGVEDLVEGISKHRQFLLESEEGRERRLERLSLEIEEILKREVARVVEDRWSKVKTPQLMQKLFERKLDPYTLAGTILSDIFGSNQYGNCGKNFNMEVDYDENLKG